MFYLRCLLWRPGNCFHLPEHSMSVWLQTGLTTRKERAVIRDISDLNIITLVAECILSASIYAFILHLVLPHFLLLALQIFMSFDLLSSSLTCFSICSQLHFPTCSLTSFSDPNLSLTNPSYCSSNPLCYFFCPPSFARSYNMRNLFYSLCSYIYI